MGRLTVLNYTAEFEKHIEDAEIIVTTPFHPAQMTKERLNNAKKLKLVLTAGIGSDHIDLHAAADNNLTVAEVQGTQLFKSLETF